jgi:hypothetical protein
MAANSPEKSLKIRGILAALKRSGAPGLPDPEEGGMNSLIPEEVDIASDRELTDEEKAEKERMSRQIQDMLVGRKQKRLAKQGGV